MPMQWLVPQAGGVRSLGSTGGGGSCEATLESSHCTEPSGCIT